MVAAAYTLTERFPGSFEDLAFMWLSAGAAVVVTLVVLGGLPAAIGWVALGYILFAAVASVRAQTPQILLILLFAAYVPMLDRPRGSLAIGLAISVVSALAFGAYVLQGAPRAQ